MAEAPAAGGTGIEASLQQTLRVISSVAAPTSVLVATLYYFGWVSTSVQANYFRFDASLLGFSTQDYLLQSISPVFLPLGAALLVVLFLVQCHIAVRRAGSDRADRLVSAVLAVTGLALFTVGLVGIVRPRPVDLMTPLGFAAGTGTLSYAVHLRRSRRSALFSETATPSGGGRGLSLSTLALSVLIGLCLVWVVAEYAEWDGLHKAERLEYNLPRKAGVVVYAKQRLLLHLSLIHI